MVFQSFNYTPSLAAAIVVAALYSLVFGLSVLQLLRYKSWVWIVMVLGVGMEAAGYIVRCISTQNVENKPIYSAQFCLVVLAPVLMAAACYVVFGRIVFHVIPRETRTFKLIWISPRFVTPIFVTSDVVALFLQLVGAVKITGVNSNESDAASQAETGKKIAQAGVAVQLICFGFFAVIALRFNFIAGRFDVAFNERVTTTVNEKYCKVDGAERPFKKNWRVLLRVTNIATAAILIRSIYRMVDFSMGRTGYTETHEWCVYVFDALPIFILVTLYVWWHPGKYLPYLGLRLPLHAR